MNIQLSDGLIIILSYKKANNSGCLSGGQTQRNQLLLLYDTNSLVLFLTLSENLNQNGRRIKKMGDPDSNNMDTSIYRHKFRFLILFFDTQIGSWDFSTSTQLFVRSFRLGKGFWLVFWCLTPLFSFVGSSVDVQFHGTLWLWSSMVTHTKTHPFALYSGQFSISFSISII